MSYFNNRKKPASEHIYAETVVWQCSECNCWSRTEFVHVDAPICPMCMGRMNQEEKMIRVE